MYQPYLLLFICVAIANALLLPVLSRTTEPGRAAWAISPIGWAISGALAVSLTYFINMNPIVNFFIGFFGAFVGLTISFFLALLSANRSYLLAKIRHRLQKRK